MSTMKIEWDGSDEMAEDIVIFIQDEWGYGDVNLAWRTKPEWNVGDKIVFFDYPNTVWQLYAGDTLYFRSLAVLFVMKADGEIVKPRELDDQTAIEMLLEGAMSD